MCADTVGGSRTRNDSLAIIAIRYLPMMKFVILLATPYLCRYGTVIAVIACRFVNACLQFLNISLEFSKQSAFSANFT